MHPNELTLNEYVDRTLDRDERAQVARHLEQCAACREVVGDIQEITRAAAALDVVAPPPRVWPGIERSLRENPGAHHAGADSARPKNSAAGEKPVPTGSRGKTHLQAWAWLAAAAVLVLAVYVGSRFGPSGDAGSSGFDAETAAAGRAIEAELQLAEEHYQKAISGLEQIASAENAAFDADTAATLQKNLAVINQAIDESRAAVRTDPASEQAQYSLMENFKTKLALLQDTVALINELRAGNDAAAARIVTGS